MSSLFAVDEQLSCLVLMILLEMPDRPSHEHSVLYVTALASFYTPVEDL